MHEYENKLLPMINVRNLLNTHSRHDNKLLKLPKSIQVPQKLACTYMVIIYSSFTSTV